MPSPPGCLAHPSGALNGSLPRQFVVVHERPKTNDRLLAVGEEWEGPTVIVFTKRRLSPSPGAMHTLEIDWHEQELGYAGLGIE
jgi:hypothetical protein